MNHITPRFSVNQDGTTLNIYHADLGEGLPRHEHTFQHLTICNAGSIVIRKEGKEVVRTKDNQPINLVANEWHEIEAVENGTVFVNVFAEGKH